MIRRVSDTSVLLGFLACALSVAQAQSAAPDVSTASLEELTQMKVLVSSFARKDEDLWVTPAPVFVINREDIERSAANSVPELLRMVPGVQVAQIDASRWAVSARGFNSAYADKLLVLIDGRTVYSEIYSGSHWDQNDLPLEEVERIEVVRGPGGVVWGTNAVNGVINIITRHAHNTVGSSASARISRIDGAAHLQYGGSLGDRLQYRGYAYYVQREPFELNTGANAFDGENTVRGGGRVGWQRSKEDGFVLSGDLYGGHLKQQIRPEFNVVIGPDGHDSGSIAGGYLLGRWEHKLPHADSALQFYFDDTSRHEVGTYTRTRTFDAEYQGHRSEGGRQDLVWGAEFRYTADRIAASTPLTTKPDYLNYLVNGFAQDEITIVPRRLVLTLGSKLQQATLSGFQAQPSGRILWSPNGRQSLWGAVSRAAVASAIQDKALVVPVAIGVEAGLPVTGTLFGNPNIKPETVVAYEGGYRQKLPWNLSVDTAGFFNVNKRLISLYAETVGFVPTPSPHILTNLLYTNGFSANTMGAEAAASWKPASTFSMQAAYSWMQPELKQTLPGPASLADTWSTARNTIAGSASWRFTPGWNVNAFVSHVGDLQTEAPAFTRVDLDLARKVGRFFVIEAGGTNLLKPRHIEFGNATDVITPAYVPRSLFLRAKWTF